jgi:hypothetical protein
VAAVPSGLSLTPLRIIIIIIVIIIITGWGGMDCTDLTQNWDKWRAFVKTVMNLRVCIT